MQIHELKPKKRMKKNKRVGRGGKRGTTSGKGQKGQKSRAGHRIRPAVREFLLRIPKLRGFKNKPKTAKYASINVDILENKILESVIDRQTLVKYKIIKPSEKNVVVLGRGELKRAFEIKGLRVSKSARQKIEKAGGKVNE